MTAGVCCSAAPSAAMLASPRSGKTSSPWLASSSHINVYSGGSRWARSIANGSCWGGLLWAVVYNALWAVSWFLFLRRNFIAAFEALGRPFPETIEWVVTYVLLTIVGGVFAPWLYAAIRPRYGPGPKTAAIAGFACWVIGVLLPTVAWFRLLEFPTGPRAGLPLALLLP